MPENPPSFGKPLFAAGSARPRPPFNLPRLNWASAALAAGFLAAVAYLGAFDSSAVKDRAAHDHGGAAHMAASTAAPVERPRSIVKPVSCEKLPHVPGKSLSTLLVEFPPNAYSPKHRHGGSVTAYVLKGTLRSQLNLDPPGVFRPGDIWFEPPGTIHTMIENLSATEPAEILATFVADDCAVLTTYID
jgi:quercetin dioxygenase-like cupin family protein